MPCLGNGADHCCYIKGKECRFLIRNYVDETGHFRRWACGLRAELGSFDAVLNDPRWIEHVKGSWASGLNCRDWPDAPSGVNRGVCAECGVNAPLKRNVVTRIGTAVRRMAAAIGLS